MNRHLEKENVLTGTLLLVCMLLFGCTLRAVQPVQYFSLLTMEQLEQTQPVGAHPELALGIGPITIPDSLKRSQIVTRVDGNQYQFNEFNRWAGVMEKDFLTVAGDNLGMLLGTENIGYFPWQPAFTPGYRVVIDIQRFDGSLAGEAVLEVRWSFIGSSGTEMLTSGRSVYRMPVAESGYAGLVRAESQLVAELCKELAVTLENLIGKKG